MDAWLKSEVPYQATNNCAFARAHASLLVRFAESCTGDSRLGASERFELLEIGAGLGAFAVHLLTALRDDLGQEGARLFRRLRYLFSDFSATTLREALARPDLASFVTEGKVIPLLFDARDPGAVHTPEGAPFALRPDAAVANYVCCVLPPRVIRRTGGEWRELYAADELPAEGSTSETGVWGRILGPHEWRLTSLPALFESPVHRAVLARSLPNEGDAELAYPEVFLELLSTLLERMLPGGLFLFSDFCDEVPEGEVAPEKQPPVAFGETLAHPVHFPLFEELARERGYAHLESGGRNGTTRTALLSRTRFSDALRSSFEAEFVHRNAGQELLDFAAAAKALSRGGDSWGALRFYDRCLGLAPREPAYYLRAAEECLALGRYPDALGYLGRGAPLDPRGVYDFQSRMGEVCLWIGEPRRALEHLEESLRFGETAGKYVLVGEASAALSDADRARRAYFRALALDPGLAPAREGLQLIEKGAPDRP